MLFKMDQKKILVITSTFPTFTENDATPPFVYELSKRLAETFDVFVSTPLCNNSFKTELKSKLKIYRFKYWFGKNNVADGAILPNLKKNKFFYIQIPFLMLFQFISVIRICKKENINIIHAHWVIPQGLVAILYKKIFNNKVKIIVSCHGSDVFGLNTPIFVKLRNYILKNSTKITVVGHEIKREINKTLDIANLTVIPMGVALNKFNQLSPLPKELTKLLFVGRLAAEKRVITLLEAFRNCTNDSVYLTIVGDGPEMRSVREFISRFNLKNINLLGAVPHAEIANIVKKHHVFILPSEREGMPVALVEAMVSGLVCIGSDIPQISDVIIDNENGYLFELNNSEDLYSKIKYVTSCQSLENISINSKMTGSNFGWNKVAEEFAKEIDV